jgi:hypothetical protein
VERLGILKSQQLMRRRLTSMPRPQRVRQEKLQMLRPQWLLRKLQLRQHMLRLQELLLPVAEVIPGLTVQTPKTLQPRSRQRYGRALSLAQSPLVFGPLQLRHSGRTPLAAMRFRHWSDLPQPSSRLQPRISVQTPCA